MIGVYDQMRVCMVSVYDQMGLCMVIVYPQMEYAWSVYILRWGCAWVMCIIRGAVHGYCISSDYTFMVSVYSQMGLYMVGVYDQMGCAWSVLSTDGVCMVSVSSDGM